MRKKKSILILTSVIVAIAMIFGVAYSYFTDYKIAQLQADAGVSLELEKDAGILSVKQSGYVVKKAGVGWYHAGDNATITAEVKTGYDFDGWYSFYEGDVNVSSSAEDVYIVDDYTILTAKSTPTIYNITYDLVDGELPAGVTNPSAYTIESDEITLNNPTKEGYTFLGWTGSNGDTPETDVTIPKGSTGDKHYVANWEEAIYNITYELNGGELPEGKTNPSTYKSSDEDITLNNPTKEGYTFLGWTGTDLTGSEETVYEDTVNLTYEDGYCYEMFSSPVPLVAGEAYNVNWKGTVYEMEAKTHSGYGFPYLGSLSLWEDDGLDTGEPLFIMSGDGMTAVASNDSANYSGELIITKDCLDKTVVIPTGSTGDRHYEAHWKAISVTLMEGAWIEESGGFNRTVPENATAIKFTDEVAPTGVALTDVSLAQDGGVVAWMDGTTYKVSTQRTGVYVEAPVNSNFIFACYNADNLASIDLTMLDTSKATSMRETFASNYNLQGIIFGDKWDTSKVDTFMETFDGCSSLISLDLSKWNTESATYMGGMFAGCRSLEAINFGNNFDTSKNKSFYEMFSGCKALKSVNVSGFDTSSAYDFGRMFQYCENIKELDISNFDTSSVSTSVSNYPGMEYMFDGMVRLEKITVGADFSFNGDGIDEAAVLPTPDATYIPDKNVDGKWYNLETREGYIPADVPERVDNTVTYVVYSSFVKVAYDANGGSFANGDSNAVVNMVLYNEGTGVELLGRYVIPINYGFEFDGWYTDAECTLGNEFDPDSDVAYLTEDITVYAKWKDLGLTVIYDANGGNFDGDKKVSFAVYDFVKKDITKISKTSNVNDDGSQNGTYASNLAVNDVVTIPGAESLEVTITYATESTSYDWVCVYDGSVTPTTSNSGSSISGMLGGGRNSTTTKKYTIPGDTVQFFFRSDSSSNYYGYYATVTGIGLTTEVVLGEYLEPTHTNSDLVFDGWFTDEACTPGNEFDPNTNVAGLTDDIIVYARWKDAVAPTLTVVSPSGGTVFNPAYFNSSSCNVSGIVSDGASEIESFIVNGNSVAVNDDGSWSTNLTLEPNEISTITFVATDTQGNSTTVTRYVFFRKPITVTYNANGGSIADSVSNTVGYSFESGVGEVTKISKTSNVGDDGSWSSGNYYPYTGSSSGITDIVTIPGAESLEVTVTYQTYYSYYDFVAVFDGSVTPTTSNSGSSISGKLGDTTKTTRTYTISGDTAQFFFSAGYSSSDSYRDYYGYYATVSGVGAKKFVNVSSGEYIEPTHSNSEFVFDGWYTDEACTPGNELNLVDATEDITVYAKWIDTVAPTLTVVAPSGDAESNPTCLDSENCVISGTVSDGVGVQSFTVNGSPVTVNDDGSWSTNLTLEPNMTTTITVVATDTQGNSTTVTRYARYQKPLTVTYDANGGSFVNGDSLNDVGYLIYPKQISKTSNVGDDGSWSSGNYYPYIYEGINDVVTIPGAEHLKVTITSQTYGTSYSWVSVYDGSVTPTRNNYNSSVSGKLGSTTKTTNTFTIHGDTVQFFFVNGGSGSNNNYYGYYAIVEPIYATDVVSGEYLEPSYGNSDYYFDGWYTDAACTPGNEFNPKLEPISDVIYFTEDITVYAKWSKLAPSVTYDANGGSFANGDSLNDVGYLITPMDGFKILKTPNVCDCGYLSRANHPDTSCTRKTVFEGAQSLEVTITYEISSPTFVAVYDGSVTPTTSNYDKSVSGQLSGSKNTRTYIVPGDTVQVLFSAGGAYNYYYGYYATVSPIDSIEFDFGEYLEPSHDNVEYVFDGWYTDAACTPGNEFDPETDVDDLTDDITVYARWKDTVAPTLTVVAPSGDAESNPTYFDSENGIVSGTVSDGVGVQSLTVNGSPVTVNDDGSWSTNLTLEPNMTTTITVVATDTQGNSTTAIRYAFYQKHLTVTYDANGGNFVNGDSDLNTVVYKFEMNGLEKIANVFSGEYFVPFNTDTELFFVGWYTDAACTLGNEFDSNADIAGLTENITVYAKWDNLHLNVVYDANGGSFTNGGSLNDVRYSIGSKLITKTSRTANVKEDGSSVTGVYPYAPNGINDIVTVPGAESLEVTITYQTYNTSTDYVAVYDGSVTPTTSNYDKSVSGKLYGAKSTRTYTISGDTAQFFFASEHTAGFYGYYATVIGVMPIPLIDSGEYFDPVHSNDYLVFDGWYTDAACTPGNEFDPNSDVAYLTEDITVYAKWKDSIKVTYDASGGSFGNGVSNTVGYVPKMLVSKISKTSNVGDDGSWSSGNYYPYTYNGINDVVTIPGAEKLEVTVTYQTYKSGYDSISDYVCVYDGSVTPTASNYDKSVSGKLYGPTKTTKTYTIEGDTAQFFFIASYSSSSYYLDYYGYYATVLPICSSEVWVGEYLEPSHDNTKYVFDGWYTDAACTPGNEFDPDSDVAYLTEDITVYAKWSSAKYCNIIYDANGGSFENGVSNTVEYSLENGVGEVTKISKTSNVGDDGSWSSGNYYPYTGSSSGINDVVTIPGAESLEVTVTYQTAHYYYDYVAVYDTSVTPTTSSFGSSITGKLGGATKTSKTYTIEGDTAQFFFTSSDSSSTSGRDYYGYYATVSGVGDKIFVNVSSGEYVEPTHTNSDLVFDGWYTDAACTPGNEFDPETDVDDLTDDITVYAKWIDTVAPTLTVVSPSGDAESNPTYFDSKNGIVSGTVFDGVGVQSFTVNGSPVTVNSDGSWSTSLNLKTNKLFTIVVTATDAQGNSATVTRYAFYQKPVTVTYNANGGSFDNGSSVNDVEYNFEISDSTEVATVVSGEYLEPSHNNMGFAGWYTDAECTNKFYINAATNNITVYAKWSSVKLVQAVYSATDNSLRFYNTFEEIKYGTVNEGKGYNGLDVTRVYTGFIDKFFETSNYDDDETREILVPWLEDFASGEFVYRQIKKVVVEDEGIAPVSTACWFENFYNCETIDITKLDTSNTIDMSYMFCSLPGLIDINDLALETLNVSRVEKMEYMLAYLPSKDGVFSLDLSTKTITRDDGSTYTAWDTSNVTNMGCILLGVGDEEDCVSFNLKGIDTWDTSNVTDMQSMFYKAGRYATSWDVGDLSTKTITRDDGSTYTAWDTSNVTNMAGMFSSTGNNTLSFNLKGVDTWDTSNVTNMAGMFKESGYADFLTDATWDVGDLSTKTITRDDGSTYTAWDTSNVTNMGSMFEDAGWGVYHFEIVGLDNWDTSNVTNMNRMFALSGWRSWEWDVGDLSTKTITRDDGSTYTAWDTSNVTDMTEMFRWAGDSAYYLLDLSNWDVSKVVSRQYFNQEVEDKIISPWKTSTASLALREEPVDNDTTYWRAVVNQMFEGETEITLDGTITEMPMDVIDAVSSFENPVTFTWNEQIFVITQETINDFEYVSGELVPLADLVEAYAVVEDVTHGEDETFAESTDEIEEDEPVGSETVEKTVPDEDTPESSDSGEVPSDENEESGNADSGSDESNFNEQNTDSSKESLEESSSDTTGDVNPEENEEPSSSSETEPASTESSDKMTDSAESAETVESSDNTQVADDSAACDTETDAQQTELASDASAA